MNAVSRLASLSLLLLTGCAMVSAPQAPSLKLPEQVTDLAAQRTGNHVDLHWTMPKRATDKVLLVGQQKVQVCRQLQSEPCVTAGNILVAPGVTASFTDDLPASLTTGPLRPLTYTVLLQNHAGRSAGPSNAALTAAGLAPTTIENLQARAQSNGIVLAWTPNGHDETVRIDRKLADKPAQNSAIPHGQSPAQIPRGQSPVQVPRGQSPVQIQPQTLEYSGPDHGQILDHDAALDHAYAYTAQRVAKLSIGDNTVEVLSEPSGSAAINARDVFPPAVPAGLQTVADAVAHSIDLSWQPNTEADLAGYIVYRSESGSGSRAAPTRLTPTPQSAPSFRDTTAIPGHTYQYSVSAIDRDGNESKPSAPVEETIPQ
jgi:hypothetical protein